MNQYIDIYCERLEHGLWAEPLNAITNAAFFIAAFFAYLFARKNNAISKQSALLIFLLCCIGAGSTLFHTVATKWAMLADVLPILFYQIAFIWIYSLSVMNINIKKSSALFGLFIIMTVIAENIPSHILNGSLSYAPSILFLFGFGLWHQKNAIHERYILILASLIFVLSLTFRSIDMALCPQIAIGTHFLWHCLNGVVLYCTTRSYISASKNR